MLFLINNAISAELLVNEVCLAESEFIAVFVKYSGNFEIGMVGALEYSSIWLKYNV